jgi:hypothetical protein|eukprot:COSAG06_NODE_2994_length_5982_cov_2.136495_4_plen_47_part_00
MILALSGFVESLTNSCALYRCVRRLLHQTGAQGLASDAGGAAVARR